MARRVRTDHSPIERLKAGHDPSDVIADTYGYKKVFPDKPPHDRSHQQEPREVLHNPMKAADQQANQFHDEQIADHNDTGRQWTRGYGSPYPHFDHGLSGARHSTKRR